MTKRYRVYCASPYSSAPMENTIDAIVLADKLMGWGFVPYVPHLYHWWDLMYPHDWEAWMNQCLPWITACDVLLRSPGESKGADREVEHAKANGIPVVYSEAELLEWERSRREAA